MRYRSRGALLPHLFTLAGELPRRRYIFCGTFRKTRFERVPPAVSRHAALWRPDFPPPLIVKMCQGRLSVHEAHFIIELMTTKGNMP